ALDVAITIAVNAISDENALNWFNHCGLFVEPTSTARRKSKVESQKSKVLWNGLFRDFKWLLYLRRGVLGSFYCGWFERKLL
ncbi:hypothetical protein, partial [Nostoc sp.]|uniref:hypothetical protein n=1 Tax=Nostoc sp. TaxID=1180 RepID=UPI002FF627B3